jgi:gluconolactonase
MPLTFETVACGLGFPEGPVAMSDGTVLFVDIMKQSLSRLRLDGGVEPLVSIPGGPNGLAIGPDKAAYVCNDGGVYDFIKLPGPNGPITAPSPNGPPARFKGGGVHRIDLSTLDVTLLYSEYDGEPLRSPDDIVFDATGGFWFTDSGVQYPDRIEKGGVYYGTIDRKPLKKVAAIPTANGIGLSPDGKTLHVADTIFGRLWALDVTGPGEVGPGRPLPFMPGRVVQTLSGYQMVDSLKVEADGRVCVATISIPEGGVTVFGDDGSTERVAVPDPFVTNLCFGGADMQDVWITASGTGRILKTRWPRPGLGLAFNA